MSKRTAAALPPAGWNREAAVEALTAKVAGGLSQCQHLFDDSVLCGMVGVWLDEFIIGLSENNVSNVGLAEHVRDAHTALDGLRGDRAHLRQDAAKALDGILWRRARAAIRPNWCASGLFEAGNALWPLAESQDPAVEQLRCWFESVHWALRLRIGRHELAEAVRAARGG